jgi:hypothetical protein
VGVTKGFKLKCIMLILLIPRTYIANENCDFNTILPALEDRLTVLCQWYWFWKGIDKNEAIKSGKTVNLKVLCSPYRVAAFIEDIHINVSFTLSREKGLSNPHLLGWFANESNSDSARRFLANFDKPEKDVVAPQKGNRFSEGIEIDASSGKRIEAVESSIQKKQNGCDGYEEKDTHFKIPKPKPPGYILSKIVPIDVNELEEVVKNALRFLYSWDNAKIPIAKIPFYGEVDPEVYVFVGDNPDNWGLLVFHRDFVGKWQWDEKLWAEGIVPSREGQQVLKNIMTALLLKK